MAKNIYSWRVQIKKDTRSQLAKLADLLGFNVTHQGPWFGDPSPAQLLDAMAEKIKSDPQEVAAVFAALGITGANYTQEKEREG